MRSVSKSACLVVKAGTSSPFLPAPDNPEGWWLASLYDGSINLQNASTFFMQCDGHQDIYENASAHICWRLKVTTVAESSLNWKFQHPHATARSTCRGQGYTTEQSQRQRIFAFNHFRIQLHPMRSSCCRKFLFSFWRSEAMQRRTPLIDALLLGFPEEHLHISIWLE